MVKTYHSRIFGGKASDWRGIDQGRGPFYSGALEFSLNATYDDNTFRSRDGQTLPDLTWTPSGPILSAGNTGRFMLIAAGEDVLLEMQ
jgi:hypothetical protein